MQHNNSSLIDLLKCIILQAFYCLFYLLLLFTPAVILCNWLTLCLLKFCSLYTVCYIYFWKVWVLSKGENVRANMAIQIKCTCFILCSCVPWWFLSSVTAARSTVASAVVCWPPSASVRPPCYQCFVVFKWLQKAVLLKLIFKVVCHLKFWFFILLFCCTGDTVIPCCNVLVCYR